jgi:septal ring factor EnvC (AmiA/AmiB activator)
LGGKGAFAEEAVLPKVKPAKKRKNSEPSAAGRKRLAAVQSALEDAQRDHAEQVKALRTELADVKQRIAEEDAEWKTRRRELAGKVEDAKKALRHR